VHRGSPTDPDEAAMDADTGIEADLGQAVWRRAAVGYAAYATRRRASAGGEPKRLPVDFLVGAHAHERADRLLTLDLQRYRGAFKGLRIEP
jgi:predicted nucleic acid-binding protein